MATPNYKPLLNSSENLKALLAEQNAEGITSAVFSGNEPIDVLSAKTIFNAAKSAEDIAGVSSITAGTGISVSGSTGNVTITSTVTGTLPTQTGNSGKLLTTDGTNSSWTTTPVATSLTGPAATALTLTGGDSGASLALGSGASGSALVTPGGVAGFLRVSKSMPSTSQFTSTGSLQLINTDTTDGNWNSIDFVDSIGGGTAAGIYAKHTDHANDYAELHLVTRGAGGLASRGIFTSTGTLLLGTTTQPASLTGGVSIVASGSGATATGVQTGGLQSANFGLSTVSGGASYFGGAVTATGNAATTNAAIFVNDNGAGGTAQYYLQGGTTATTIWRMLRGNGAAGYEANGLNIDSFAGMQIKLNALGGSGGSFTVTGGAATFSGAVTVSGGTAASTPALTVNLGENNRAGYAMFGNTPTSFPGRAGIISQLRVLNYDDAMFSKNLVPVVTADTAKTLESTPYAGMVLRSTGNIDWVSNSTSTAGAAITPAVRMALDTSGNLAVTGAVTAQGLFYPPQTAPASPASGWVLYTDSGDGNKLKAKASTGTVVTIGTP